MAQQVGGRAFRAAEYVSDVQDQQVDGRLLQHIREARLQPPEDIGANTQHAHCQQPQTE